MNDIIQKNLCSEKKKRILRNRTDGKKRVPENGYYSNSSYVIRKKMERE